MKPIHDTKTFCFIIALAVVGLTGRPDAMGAQAITNLHSFGSFSSDGESPGASLILVGANTLYGTTSAGGGNNYGTVFAINLDGSGYTNLHEFGSIGDGRTPQASLILVGSNTLFGTTTAGGTNNDGGIVFSVNTDGSGYTNLHEFGSTGDGRTPEAALTLVGSTLYGTTFGGGTNGNGTIFALNPDGSGYTTLYRFGSGVANDAASPWASVTAIGSRLYGTTYYGGANDKGAIFAIDTNGSNYAVLYPLGSSHDGDSPKAPLTVLGGRLYGTAFYGGMIGDGTLFAINPDGSGFTNLHQFETSGYDGQYPLGLTVVDSKLYGTTYAGGSNSNYGTVFSLNTNGTGYTTVFQFGATVNDAKTPKSELILVGTNTFYGTTFLGGANGAGAVFKLTVTTGGGGGGGSNLTGTLSKVKDKCKTKNNVTTCKLGAGLALFNTGNNEAPATHVRFFLSTDANYDVGVDTQLGEATTKAIKPGKSGKAKLKAVTNASSAGQFVLAVDDNDTVLAALQVPGI